MKGQLQALRRDPILVDRAARTFGSFREAFAIRSRIRGHGSLSLYEDRLVFERTGEDPSRIEIPLADIQRIGLGRWHRGQTDFVAVLKITYSGNLVFGVHVHQPERWVSAIEACASGAGAIPTVDARSLHPINFRYSRGLIIGFLLVALLISIALPLFFVWMESRAERDALPGDDAPAPLALPG